MILLVNKKKWYLRKKLVNKKLSFKWYLVYLIKIIFSIKIYNKI